MSKTKMIKNLTKEEMKKICKFPKCKECVLFLDVHLPKTNVDTKVCYMYLNDTDKKVVLNEND